MGSTGFGGGFEPHARARTEAARSVREVKGRRSMADVSLAEPAPRLQVESDRRRKVVDFGGPRRAAFPLISQPIRGLAPAAPPGSPRPWQRAGSAPSGGSSRIYRPPSPLS